MRNEDDFYRHTHDTWVTAIITYIICRSYARPPTGPVFLPAQLPPPTPSLTRDHRPRQHPQLLQQRHLRQALKDDPADTRSRIHLIELLRASGDDGGALDVSRAGGASDDFDVHAQRIALLLEQLHRGTDASNSVRASRKKPKRSTATVSVITPPAAIIDEVLDCCEHMLSLDPGSMETIELLVTLRDRGLLERFHAGRTTAILKDWDTLSRAVSREMASEQRSPR